MGETIRPSEELSPSEMAERLLDLAIRRNDDSPEAVEMHRRVNEVIKRELQENEAFLMDVQRFITVKTN